MTAKRSPNAKSFGFWEEQAHAQTVPCPDSPRGCGQPAGAECLGPDGQPFHGPGHHNRIKDADAANPAAAHPAVADEPAPAPARRLVSASQVRRDLADHREPCRYCHAAIVWATNAKDDRLPVDADPHAEGTHWLTVDERGVRVGALTTGQAAGAREQGQRLHRPHRKSCPKRQLWSRHA